MISYALRPATVHRTLQLLKVVRERLQGLLPHLVGLPLGLWDGLGLELVEFGEGTRGRGRAEYAEGLVVEEGNGEVEEVPIGEGRV